MMQVGLKSKNIMTCLYYIRTLTCDNVMPDRRHWYIKHNKHMNNHRNYNLPAKIWYLGGTYKEWCINGNFIKNDK